MEEDKKTTHKHLDLNKLLIGIFFIGVTILLEHIYALTNTTIIQSHQDVFPSWISSLGASILVQINPALTHPFFNTIFFVLTQIGRASVIVIFSLFFHFLEHIERRQLNVGQVNSKIEDQAYFSS